MRQVGQVGQVGRIRLVGGMGRLRGLGQVGRVGRIGLVGGMGRLGVRAKASECMELGMWDEWDGERILNFELWELWSVSHTGDCGCCGGIWRCNYELSIECRASSKRVR